MTVKHIVLFGWKEDATKEQIEKACADMVGLAKNCVHAQTQKPYIRSCVGGKNISQEGFHGDTTYGFVMEFDSVADRDYYVKEDPIHKAFGESVGPIISGIRVIDFEDGKF